MNTNRKALYAMAIGLAVLAASCKREATAPPDDGAAPASTPPPAVTDTPNPDPALAARDGRLEEAMAMPETPAQYKRPVDVALKGAVFSTSGDDTNDTLGTPVTSFSAKDSVYVEFSTQGTDGDYMITTRWIDPSGETLLENGRTVADAGPERTIFSLSKPDGWAPGTYRIQVEINGKPAGEYPFTVK